MNEERYYHFKNVNGEVITILAEKYAKAVNKAIKYGKIIEYLGWTETLKREDYTR